jgi:hypothetical protein
MKTPFKLSIAFALSALAIFAQGRYSATTGDVSLSSAGTTLTLQQPSTAGAGRQITLESATVYCSVACSITQAMNGAAATSTAGTLTPISPAMKPAYSSVFTASNVGAGTAIGGIIHLGAGQTIVLDLSQITIGAGLANANYSISIGSLTGTVNITLIEVER